MPQVKKPVKPLKGEIVTKLLPSKLNREMIFEVVIEFLERMKEGQYR